MATRLADLDELIRQASRNEPAQLDTQICEGLMLAYYDVVFRLALAYPGDSSKADDAAQETFLQAALHIHPYAAGTNGCLGYRALKKPGYRPRYHSMADPTLTEESA